VGLTPELLPAILSINLTHGAREMAARGVLVRRLDATENLGSMDVLCTDKTGTLTVGAPRLERAEPSSGARVLELAAVNARLQSGLPSMLDDVIDEAAPKGELPQKLGEVPYDFVRKRIGVAALVGGRPLLVVKGAADRVLDICDIAAPQREELERNFGAWGAEGLRVIAVATRELEAPRAPTRDDERGLKWAGALLFADPPRDDAAEAVAALRALGVQVKMITGDAAGVARHVAERVGLEKPRVLKGDALDTMTDESLWHEVEQVDVFAQVDPHEKERIIRALRHRGHVVGYMGDGINDGPAMHAADVSLSVDSAVDVAREAADFVLLEKSLEVLRRGVLAGRTTYANTLKYVLMASSANFGNMMSMAGASLLLPFLPMLASQVLLNNLLSDIPAMSLASDAVDEEQIAQPCRWEMRFIARFMVEFGLLSSVFDFATFAALWFVYRAGPELFHTGWFFESLLTELLILYVVRTRGFAFASKPGRLLVLSTAAITAIDFALPYLPFAHLLGFVPLPFEVLGGLTGITLVYATAAEVTKRWFYRSKRELKLISTR
jgi:Mg2+-importing ATPase